MSIRDTWLVRCFSCLLILLALALSFVFFFYPPFSSFHRVSMSTLMFDLQQDINKGQHDILTVEDDYTLTLARGSEADAYTETAIASEAIYSPEGYCITTKYDCVSHGTDGSFELDFDFSIW